MKTTTDTMNAAPVSLAVELRRAARENSVSGYAFAGGYIAASFEWGHLSQQELLDVCNLLHQLPTSPSTRDEVLAWSPPAA